MHARGRVGMVQYNRLATHRICKNLCAQPALLWLNIFIFILESVHIQIQHLVTDLMRHCQVYTHTQYMQPLTISWQLSSNASNGDSVCSLASILSLSLRPITVPTATSRECHVRGWEPVPEALCDHRARSSNAQPSTLCSLRLTVSKTVCSTPKACPTSSHFAAMVGTMSLRMSNRDGLAPTKHTRCTNKQYMGYTACTAQSVWHTPVGRMINGSTHRRHDQCMQLPRCIYIYIQRRLGKSALHYQNTVSMHYAE